MARVIVLNGVSSAGKSSLAGRMQELSQDDWLHVSMDSFLAMLPNGREAAPEWFIVEDKTVDQAIPVVSITNGPRGKKLLDAMRIFISAAADRGIDVIVDDVCTDQEINDYRRRLAGHELRIIKVKVAAEVAEQREKSRGDRLLGLAREQAARIHQGIDYDCIIDNRDGMLDTNSTQLLTLFD